MTTSAEGEAALRGGEREERMPVGLTRILLCQKMKKIHPVDSAGKMDGEDLKQ
jgi:hypothetical protein